jgi:hypothetical protein
VTTPSLPEKILAIERALTDVPHAFGGALALAYHAEPRATIDIDLNVFLPAASTTMTSCSTTSGTEMVLTLPVDTEIQIREEDGVCGCRT